jgi:hypothetical protein
VFNSNDFILKAFNRRISQLVESGIIQKIIKDEASYVKHIEDEEPPKLSLHHFENWLILCAILLVVSGIVFIGEFLSRKFEKTAKQR